MKLFLFVPRDVNLYDACKELNLDDPDTMRAYCEKDMVRDGLEPFTDDEAWKACCIDAVIAGEICDGINGITETYLSLGDKAEWVFEGSPQECAVLLREAPSFLEFLIVSTLESSEEHYVNWLLRRRVFLAKEHPEKFNVHDGMIEGDRKILRKKVLANKKHKAKPRNTI